MGLLADVYSYGDTMKRKVRGLLDDPRGTGAGNSNFVVFPGNENLLQILERNGQPIKGLLGQ